MGKMGVLPRNSQWQMQLGIQNCICPFQNELFQLVTDQGFLNEANVVWETLSNVEGDCHFVDSEFRTYTKPEVSLQPVQPPNVALNSDEQIDQE